MSHVTEKTLERIAEQKKHIEKIKALSEFISMRGEESEDPSDKEDIDIIERAVACQWSVIKEEVLKNGSEDGNLLWRDTNGEVRANE